MQPLSAPRQRSDIRTSARFREMLLQYLPQIRLDSPFFIRLRHWEYWPFEVVYLPIFFYYIWLSIKARSLFFFSASNPFIETGGLLGESKAGILDSISDEFKPITLFVPALTPIYSVVDQVHERGLTYPLIAKPNVGERGWRVEKIESQGDLINYLQSNSVDFLIQEYVDEPLELGVFYYRMPGQEQGVVSSIVQKEFLAIRGNGRDCIENLISQNERAILQLPALTAKYGNRFHEILPPGETLTLVSIGNHCKGTKFLNANHLITPELTRVFDHISQSIDGFYFGRYDLRCRSVADLYAGKHIRILELNGAGAEPAHIYQPGFSLWEAYRVLFHHWRVLYDISRENHRRGVAYMTLDAAVQIWNRTRKNKM
ncbi:hypothetical protein EXU85_02675 [Spirosoma sp. KCTC 42546]|uniref:hypothetical protein n=1 Tax=Spirosoma sp. KCTC 42546 TaxID=2520506 RepID=UPI0011584897|nr:hypothetical protein [Spirosoma sp. KCTC 42546]QDK77557.1 hypothetical protein EXU85_02675 [Spirosoma sp. KCTC 42546]